MTKKDNKKPRKKQCCESHRKFEYECTTSASVGSQLETSASLVKSLQDIQSTLITLGITLQASVNNVSLEFAGQLSQFLSKVEETKLKISQTLSESIVLEESITCKYSTDKFDECEQKLFKKWLCTIDAIKNKRCKWLNDASSHIDSANCLISDIQKQCNISLPQ
jgi:uncharacterized protein YggL (DUF469 family)